MQLRLMQLPLMQLRLARYARQVQANFVTRSVSGEVLLRAFERPVRDTQTNVPLLAAERGMGNARRIDGGPSTFQNAQRF